MRTFHGSPDLLDGRQRITLPDHLSPIDQDGEFTPLSLDHFHLGVGVLLQGRRQTGGELPGPLSDRAFSDGYLIHS